MCEYHYLATSCFGNPQRQRLPPKDMSIYFSNQSSTAIVNLLKKKKFSRGTSVSVLLQSSIGCYLVVIGGGHAEGEWNAADFKYSMPGKGRFGHRPIASTHPKRRSELSGTVYDYAIVPGPRRGRLPSQTIISLSPVSVDLSGDRPTGLPENRSRLLPKRHL